MRMNNRGAVLALAAASVLAYPTKESATPDPSPNLGDDEADGPIVLSIAEAEAVLLTSTVAVDASNRLVKDLRDLIDREAGVMSSRYLGRAVLEKIRQHQQLFRDLANQRVDLSHLQIRIDPDKGKPKESDDADRTV